MHDACMRSLLHRQQQVAGQQSSSTILACHPCSVKPMCESMVPHDSSCHEGRGATTQQPQAGGNCQQLHLETTRMWVVG